MFHHIHLLHCTKLEAAVQRGSGRACPKTTRHGDTRDAPHVAAYSQTKQKLFAWFSSARSSGSAARPGAAAEAYSCTWLSYLYTSCSTFAAALAAHVSYKATGAGGSASSAAHAAKPNLVSGDGTDKSAKGSRSSSHPVPHRSTKVCFLLHYIHCASAAVEQGREMPQFHTASAMPLAAALTIPVKRASLWCLHFGVSVLCTASNPCGNTSCLSVCTALICSMPCRMTRQVGHLMSFSCTKPKSCLM